MADGCRLPKVIVVLALLFPISCVALRYDDLLDRVRLSKSNEPEVRDFLKSVLRHHGDFRWISHEADKYTQPSEGHLLPLRGISQKSKRSFYSVPDDLDEAPMSRYVYRPDNDDFDDDDFDEDVHNDGDVQSFASRSRDLDVEDSNLDGRGKSTSKLADDDLDFDGPVNDVYPYKEAYPRADNDRRFVRETQDAFLYDDLPLDEDDLFEEGAQTRVEAGSRSGEEDQAELVSDDRHGRSKRSASTEALLDEKMLLHRVLHKPSNQESVVSDDRAISPQRYNRNGPEPEHESHGFNSLAFHMPGDAIEVIPASQKGVNYVPGTKLERYGEFIKSEQDAYNQQDLQDLQKHKSKRKCSESLMESDFKVPELFGPNKSQNSDIDLPLSEFYYSIPHDVIGLNQDLIGDNVDMNNVSCKKFRRSTDWEEQKKAKGIKIKIFDEGEFVKDIQKDQTGNSVVLTIKTNDNRSPKMENDQLESDDDTLKTIDSIIKSDKASLRHSESLNSLRMINEGTADDETLSKDDVPRGSGNVKGMLKSSHRKYNKVDRMDTSVVPYTDDQQIFFGASGRGYNRPANDYQNRLEDQTEPTSAAEQRELGKIGSVYTTEPMDVKTTSEKFIIIPLKKSIEDDVVHEGEPFRKEVIFGAVISKAKIKIDGVDDKRYVTSSDNQEGEIPDNSDERNQKHILSRNEVEESEDNEDEKEKRSKDEGNIEEEVSTKEELKADAFRSRKLFSFEESVDSEQSSDFSSDADMDPELNAYLNRNYNAEEREKKDVRTSLGMRNDQDYSEDKIDSFGDDERSKKKAQAKSEKRRGNLSIKNRLLGKIINTQQEKKALKARLAKTKSSRFFKIKKDLAGASGDVSLDEEDQNDGEDVEQTEADGDGYQHLIVKEEIKGDINADEQTTSSSKHVRGRYDIGRVFDSRGTTTKDNIDRCCENSKTGSTETEPIGSIEANREMETSGSLQEQPKGSSGNELDIIEKTQAILLHITGPPGEQGKNDNDVRETYKGDRSDQSKLSDPSLTVKRVNSFRVIDDQDQTGPQKEPENVVSEIIKLVQNYKNKVNEYNKNNPKSQDTRIITKSSINRNKGKVLKEKNYALPDIEKDKAELKIFDCNSSELPTLETEELESRHFTKAMDDDSSTYKYSTVISSDLEDVSEAHSHGPQKAKKLHPLKDNQCVNKVGNDSNEDFIAPTVVREGYIKPEVVADEYSVDKSTDKDVKHDQKRHSDYESSDTLKSLKKGKKFIKIDPLEYNPMQFTPDTLVGFKDIVESDKHPIKLNRRQNLSPLDDYSEMLDHQVYKRELEAEDDDKEYTEEELDKLLEMVDDSAADIKSDQELLKRYRRYKNFEPFFNEALPRHRHSEDAKVDGTRQAGSSPAPGLSAAEVPSSSSTAAPLCGEVEQQTLAIEPVHHHHHHKKRKKHGHNHKCTFGEDDEFGDTSKVHNEVQPKKSKGQRLQEIKQRERTKGMIYEEQAVEKQKEQQRIKNVLNGHLVLDIMDKFQNKVKENARLNNRFGQAIGRKCATDEVNLIDKFKEEQTKSDIRHAQLMLHQVIVLMNKIVAEQVHRRTCLILSPTLKSYLKRTVGNRMKMAKSSVIAEGYPLPAMKENGSKKDNALDDSQGDFLFPGGGRDEDKPQSQTDQALQMRKKINMIKALLNKYNHMSRTCQIKVEPVHDYLVSHLKSLEKMSKNKQWGEPVDTCDVPCRHEQPQMPATKGAPPPREAQGGSSTFAVVTTIGGDSSSELSSATMSDVTVSPLSENNPKPKSRGATFRPPEYKEYNKNRLFRNYDDDSSDSGGDSNPGEYQYPSEKYKKLVEAAATYRRKRQIEERLARLFGRRGTTKEDIIPSTSRSDDEMEPDISNVAFEAPTVYSLH